MKSNTYSALGNQVLTVRIMRIVRRVLMPVRYLLGKIHLNLSDWIAFLIFELLLACLVFAIWALLKLPVNPGGKFWVLWGNMLTAVCVILVDKNLDSFLRTLDLYVDEVTQHNRSSFTQWINKAFDLQRQIIISFIFSMLIFPATLLFFDRTIGFQANRFGAIVLFVNMWVIGNGFYWIVILPTSAKAIFHSSRMEGYFDPKNTIWIDGLSSIYENAAVSVSIIGVLALFSLLPSQLLTVRYISLGWLFLILILISAPFLYAKSYLSKLIQYMRYSTMTSIQRRTADLLQQKGTLYVVQDRKVKPTIENFEKVIDTDELKMLLNIYDLTKRSESSLLKLSSSLQFINSLLLPIASFLVVNYTQLVSIIQNIIKALF